MHRNNLGIEFDPTLFQCVSINQPAIEDQVRRLCAKKTVKKTCKVGWLLRAVTCIDLTSLSGDDSYSNIHRLCLKAESPISTELLGAVGMNARDVHAGAICVYPARVSQCAQVMQTINSNVPIAAVATGFPSGQYALKTRLDEIHYAIQDGANEIDIVINRDLALLGKWEELYKEVLKMRGMCPHHVCMKTILSTGELGSLTNVYKASMVCMMAGADFIKTSTGKENVNATLPVGVVMTRAIKDYFEATDFKVGFKPAGGIRTAKDVLLWQMLMREQLGVPWMFPALFRIGASGLITDIERQIFYCVNGCYASPRSFPLV